MDRWFFIIMILFGVVNNLLFSGSGVPEDYRLWFAIFLMVGYLQGTIIETIYGSSTKKEATNEEK